MRGAHWHGPVPGVDASDHLPGWWPMIAKGWRAFTSGPGRPRGTSGITAEPGFSKLSERDLVLRREQAGPNGIAIECWHLSEKNGTFWVEHTWWHPANTSDVGSETIQAGYIFAKDDEELCGKLRAAISHRVTRAKSQAMRGKS